jgi:hypothetical protein
MPSIESDAQLPAREDESTGLPIPGLNTWRRVYLFVAILLAAYIVMLTVLGKVFSS